MTLESGSEAVNYEQYNEELLDPAVMQELQDHFCDAQHVYAACFSRSREEVTHPYGSREARAFLDERIGAGVYESLLLRLVASQYESVLEAEIKDPHTRVCGLSVRVKGAIAALWIVIGVTSLPEEEVLPEGLMVTDAESFDHSLSLLETVSKRMLSARLDEMFAQEASRRATGEREAARQELKRNKAVTNIVLMQESENSFAKVVNDILEQTVRYLSLGSAALWRLDQDGESVDMICEFVGEHGISYASKVRKLPKERVPFLTGKPYMISYDSMKPEEFDRLFRNNDIKAAVSLPVEINGNAGMYLTFVENLTDRVWDVNDIKFLNDVRQIIQSILQRRIARNSLASSYASLEAVLENVGCGIFVESENKEILFLNKAFKELCPNSGRLRNIESLFEPERIRETDGFQELYSEKEGRWYDLRVSTISWVDGSNVKLYTLYDFTERKRRVERLETKNGTDRLTGLFNKEKCLQDLDNLLLNAIGPMGSGAILMMDIDNFKTVNEGVGHQYGDLLLKQIGSAILKLPGNPQNCYRMEGDEFLIILNHHQLYLLNDIIEEIRALFVRPWYLRGEDHYCNMCMSIVRFPEDGTDSKDLLRKARISMADAKHNGKNNVVFYNDKIRMTEVRRPDMERCLLEAVNSGCEEFEVYYQPVTDIRQGVNVCQGAEALVRWNSSELGMIPPSAFLPMADYLELMPRIGEHVLTEACNALRYWNDYGHPEYRVSVNLSTSQLIRNDIVERISRIVTMSNIQTDHLTLDVTEAFSVSNMTRVKQVLSEIRRFGIRVALDDFGVGASSLNHIRELPIDQIKIDPSFVRDIQRDEYSAVFVRMVAELSHTIGISTIVEGVETAEQLDKLREIGAEFIQGYYFGHPMRRDEFEKLYL